MNSYLKSALEEILSPEALGTILRDSNAIGSLPSQLQQSTRLIFARGYAVQIRILIGFAAVQLLSVGLVWRKKQIKVP
jgi:hypothetical protein